MKKGTRRWFLKKAGISSVVAGGNRKVLGCGPVWGEALPWKAGVAKMRITPEKPLWMAGYASRTKPSQGTLQELYAKALALEDESGRRAVLVTSDLLGFPAVVSDHIAERVRKQFGLARDRLILNSSHTHCSPALASPIQFIYGPRTNAKQQRDVEDYIRLLESQIVEVIGVALKDLRPARLSFGRREATFGVNRRLKTDKGIISFVANPDGPADHDVPFLKVDSNQGQLRSVVFGYACHPTTIGDEEDYYKFNGDYAGFAQEWLEKQYPGAVALFVQGCGGDVNTVPRGTIELARSHGETLAAAVEKGISSPLRPIGGPLRAAFEIFPVAFAAPPSRTELEAELQHEDLYFRWHAKEMLNILDRHGRLPADYPYPLQVWQFGQDLTFIAMAGEVVVDYSLKLKRELGGEKLWVAGYCNDVFAYIPSLRVLQEGGYEGGGAMIYYLQPGPFAVSVEETIMGKVYELIRRVGRIQQSGNR